MREHSCAGRKALGPCTNEAIFWVAGQPACGVHMPQLVKHHLRSPNAKKVCVTKRPHADHFGSTTAAPR